MILRFPYPLPEPAADVVSDQVAEPSGTTKAVLPMSDFYETWLREQQQRKGKPS